MPNQGAVFLLPHHQSSIQPEQYSYSRCCMPTVPVSTYQSLSSTYAYLKTVELNLVADYLCRVIDSNDTHATSSRLARTSNTNHLPIPSNLVAVVKKVNCIKSLQRLLGKCVIDIGR